MTNRRRFLASISALVVPLALWKRGDVGVAEARMATGAPERPQRVPAELDFRRYLGQASRAQGRAAFTPELPLDR
jgi:hypothetical protein